MVPKLCAGVLRNNKLGRGRALGCFKCFEGNLTSSGHHANDQLKEIHSVSSCYIPFHDIISLQSWVFSIYCDNTQVLDKYQCETENEGGGV